MPSRPLLTELAKPFIVAVVTDREPAAALATMRLAALEGAQAMELNLPLLADADAGALHELIAAASGSVYTSCRRREFMRVYGVDPTALPAWSDDERMERQLAAVAAGSRAIDIEMDTFDPRPAPPLGTAEAAVWAAEAGEPAELSLDPAAVARQAEIARAARGAGAEAIFSCHTGRPQTIDGLLRIARLAAVRGADLVKIVSPCATSADLYAVFEATRRLATCSPIPFTVIGAGPAGDLSRVVGVNFGACWAIGQLTLTPGGFHPQPLVAQLRETMRLIPWRAETE
ncbi:MAG TPA: type I 3-dehydroquinate dehydratase [Thermomicrobiales bacterium]|nr:type I 3-dehydroquinate dehydratase [Thermomicrobiales bacterium]